MINQVAALAIPILEGTVHGVELRSHAAFDTNTSVSGVNQEREVIYVHLFAFRLTVAHLLVGHRTNHFK